MNNKRELIKYAILDVDKKYINNKFEINSGLNTTLKNKYEKVDKDEEKYIELLRFNIIFYKSIIKKLESIIEMWIQNDLISSTESVEKSIENITNSSREYVNKAMKQGNRFLNDKDKKIFMSYENTSGLKKIEKIENDYKILNLYKDILGMVINVISSDAKKYKDILEMGMEEAKIDIKNEIFGMINEILFSVETPKVEFKDEALVEGVDITGCEIADDEKCLSFTKYVSMISTPEISVKINDMFRVSVQREGIDEDDAFGFNETYKDYLSCVVLLMDYVSAENRRVFENTFRMFVIGKITESEFEEIIERLIRDKTFLDKRTWLECQKIVKSDFNMQNNNFFGRKVLSNVDDDCTLNKKMNILENLDGDSTISSIFDMEKFEDSDEISFEEEGGFAKKLKLGFSSFSEKLKIKEDDSEKEKSDKEFYDDEFEYDDYEYDEDESDEYEEKSSIKSKFKNLFSKNKDEDEAFEEEYDEEEPLDEELFEGASETQDKNALAILRLKEKSKRRENEHLKKEYNELRSERQIAEEINKNGIAAFTKNPDIVFGDSDYVRTKRDRNLRSESLDLFDDTINGQMSIFDEEFNEGISEKIDDTTQNSSDINEKIVEFDREEDSQFVPILGHTQRLSLKKIDAEINKTKVLDPDISDVKEAITSELDNELSVDKAEVFDETDYNDDEHIEVANNKVAENSDIHTDVKQSHETSQGRFFEELEALKAMKGGTKVTTNNVDSKIDDTKVDLSSLGIKNKYDEFRSRDSDNIQIDKNRENKDSDSHSKSIEQVSSFEEKPSSENISLREKRTLREEKISKEDRPQRRVEVDEHSKNESNFMDKIKAIPLGLKQKSRDEEHDVKSSSDDENTIFPKKKIVRDGIIAVVIVALIFIVYVSIIKGFNVPTVQETNNATSKTVSKSDKNSSSGEQLNKDTTKLTQKTEEEKNKDATESKASQLDREADQYKAGKGVYYTVFVGATRDKDAAQSVANNFAKRGIKAEVIRNSGYYMLKNGEYFDYNQALTESRRVSAKGVQNYIATQNKYYDLKISAFKERIQNLSKEQLKTDYDDLRNQISSTGKNASYVKNLDEIYNNALKEKQ